MAARRMGRGAAIVALASCVFLVPISALGAPGGHHPNPTPGQLAHSHHVVLTREHQIAAAAVKIGRAKAQLNQLTTQAEVASEAYDRAMVELGTAQRAVHTAQVVLTSANRQVATGQKRVANFVRAAYQTGGLSTVSAYIEPGGAAALVSRVGSIDAVSNSEHTTLQRYQAAQVYQGVVASQAKSVQDKAAAAAQVADHAKTLAAAAVARQTTQLSGLRHEQARVRDLLSAAKSHASKLQQAHLAAIARQRRRAAARAATPPPSSTGPSPYSGSSGSTAGTVSAATATAAVSSAESQIGKPYVWAAAGPNSYDCSGLTMWAYAQNGVHLDHFTGDQWDEGAHVSRAQLRPGDLVFFAYDTADPSTIHHVGMYVGNGQMVDAPYTGVNVRYDYAFRSDYIGAVRPYQR